MTGRPTPRMTGPELDLDREIANYASYFADLEDHAVHLVAWTARYSRGDELEALRPALAAIAGLVRGEQQKASARYGKESPLFRYLDDHGQPKYAALYRNGLALLSLALCLAVGDEPARQLLAANARGDTLIELLRGELVGERAAETRDAFPRQFGGLYAACAAPADARPRIVEAYLAEWYDVRIDGFGFKRQYEKVGVWCFEAAGVVAALDIDDRTFAGHRHYPADLVRFFRANRRPATPVRADEAVALPSAPEPVTAPPWPKAYTLDEGALRRFVALLADRSEVAIAAGWRALVDSLVESATDPRRVDASTAQRRALGAAFRALGEQRATLVLDWKATDQLAPLCRSLAGLECATSFRWRPGEDDHVADGLAAFARHAATHGHTLVRVESLADEFWAAVLPNERSTELLALADQLGLRARVERADSCRDQP